MPGWVRKILKSDRRHGHGLLLALLLLLAACTAGGGSTPTVGSAGTPLAPTPTLKTTATPASLPATVVPSATPTTSVTPTAQATETSTLPPTATATATAEPAAVSFAVIGDYGQAGQPEADVAALITGWEPDFIITTGDNNYPDGTAETIDDNIGRYYADYIYPYNGSYPRPAGETANRFFPTMGNHDVVTDGGQPYLDYFVLPGNERYYEMVWEPVHLFALNSNWNEPDGIRANSAQAAWLQERLAASTMPWRIVYMHTPPFSSAYHGSNAVMQWPYGEWGASVVLAGHDHVYERLLVNGLPYLTVGASGYPALYAFNETLPGSQVRFRDDYGALHVQATAGAITFEFITRTGQTIDTYTLTAND